MVAVTNTVGSAITRRLESGGFGNLVKIDREEVERRFEKLFD